VGVVLGMLRFAYKDVGKERKQDAEALPNLPLPVRSCVVAV
jgi:hypothetical protein